MAGLRGHAILAVAQSRLPIYDSAVLHNRCATLFFCIAILYCCHIFLFGDNLIYKRGTYRQ